MSGALATFLKRNAVPISTELPLFHTTKSYHLRKLLETNELRCQPCDVFIGDNLSYFFVGRPAYKYHISSETDFWNLPLSFILEYSSVKHPKRIYPFDSGGHVRGQTPDYLADMPLEEFEISEDPQAPLKVIGTFFGTTTNYFRFQGRSSPAFLDESPLSPLDAEIHALHKLSRSTASKSFDDRHFAIEIQNDKNLPLSPDKVLAVILPINYLDEPEVAQHIRHVWDAEILTYDIFPLNGDYYYYAIYERVSKFLKARGYIK